MTHIATKAFLAAALGLGSLASAPASALADGIYFEFGGGGPRQFRDRDRHEDRHDDRDRDRHENRFPRWDGFRDRDRFMDGGCSPRDAVRKAWNMGLNRPQVVQVTPRRIVVEGEARQHRLVTVVFGNFPGCPAF